MSRANPILIDGQKMTVAEFQSAKNLHVDGSLDLSGTGITALPEGLHVDGSLDLLQHAQETLAGARGVS